MSVSARLSVCLRPVSVCFGISKTKYANFTEFSVHVALTVARFYSSMLVTVLWI